MYTFPQRNRRCTCVTDGLSTTFLGLDQRIGTSAGSLKDEVGIVTISAMPRSGSAGAARSARSH
jgi:hypothetical protein